jgi:oxygen-dependent protoporphyrinogen oxidase
MAHPRVVILGGGLAGLCAARALRAAHPRASVTLLEAAPRLGGWLHSERAGGLLFERGCRGMRPSGSGATALALVEALGLAPLALPSAPSAALRYIQHGGRLLAVPTSLAGALRSPLTRSAPAWALRDLLAPAPPPLPSAAAAAARDESVAAFAERHFGAHVARVLLDAALGGIYAGDVDRLSARSVLGALWRAEAQGHWGGGQRASVLLGLLRQQLAPSAAAAAAEPPSPFVRAMASSASVSFVDGLGTLVGALERELALDPGVQLLRGCRAVRLSRSAPAAAAAATTSVLFESSSAPAQQPRSGTLEADALVFALPAPALALLLEASLPALPDAAASAAAAAAARAAAGVPMASVGVVGLGWRHAPSAPSASPYPALPHRGFGYLVPECTRRAEAAAAGAAPAPAPAPASSIPLLGMTWDSEVFPGQEEGWAQACAAGRAVARDAPPALGRQETRVSVMLGGARHCSSGEWGEEAMLAAAMAATRHRSVRIGVGAAPAVSFVSLAREAIPQYTLGHEGRVGVVEEGLRGAFGGAGRVAMVGNSWRGVGAADTAAGALEAGGRLGRALLLQGAAL